MRLGTTGWGLLQTVFATGCPLYPIGSLQRSGATVLSGADRWTESKRLLPGLNQTGKPTQRSHAKRQSTSPMRAQPHSSATLSISRTAPCLPGTDTAARRRPNRDTT